MKDTLSNKLLNLARVPKHTPLPWRYHSGRGADPRYHIQTTGGFQVASTPHDTEVDEQTAAFIVRACNAHYDLLAVLSQIASYPTRCNMTDGGGDLAHQEMAQLAANALAKAKGQL